MCNHVTTVVDTAYEQEEIAQPNGDTILELTRLEIEHCPTCETVVDWRATEL